jgi:hypothetical protein
VPDLDLCVVEAAERRVPFRRDDSIFVMANRAPATNASTYMLTALIASTMSTVEMRSWARISASTRAATTIGSAGRVVSLFAPVIVHSERRPDRGAASR